MAEQKVYNWGIISCGDISFDFANALLTNKRCNIIACASRNQTSSNAFAKKFGIPLENAYPNYKDIMKNKNIDILYIGCIHLNHYKTTLLGLHHNKHILCEKPATMNMKQLNHVLKLAKQKNKFYMEGLWTKFFPVINQAKSWIKDGKIGNIRTVSSNFGLNLALERKNNPNSWKWNNKYGGGIFLRLGMYCVAMCVMLYGIQMPKEIKALANMDKQGNVDANVYAMLKYDDNKYGVMYTTMENETTNDLLIIGDKGTIKVFGYFHAPTKIRLDNNDGSITREFPLKTECKYKMKYRNGTGFIYEIKGVIQCLDEGKIESNVHSWNDTIACMKILDKIRKQIGLRYDADNMDAKL